MFKKIMLATVLAASVGSVAVPAVAQGVRVAPPPARHEVAPPPRHGYAWMPGHWQWNYNRYQWVQGSWVRERRGERYDEPRWVQRDGRWYMQGGGWRRADRDGDGVPNRYDRAPNNPYRY